ncbi:unnamed protein product [Ceratitis capitata]|uniref:(Mediterranean fruit fly) hypothetical protein n=1 Tax=Ceratitis capitata TaxID=7213 RepID=A0A811VBL3_CERCA|nr:unnamed protein product [Ceratitis capitata]
MAKEPFLPVGWTTTTSTITIQTAYNQNVTNNTRMSQQNAKNEKLANTKTTKCSTTNITVNAHNIRLCAYKQLIPTHTTKKVKANNVNVSESVNRWRRLLHPASGRKFASPSGYGYSRSIRQHSSSCSSSSGVSANWLLLLSLLIACFIGDSLQIKNGKCDYWYMINFFFLVFSRSIHWVARKDSLCDYLILLFLLKNSVCVIWFRIICWVSIIKWSPGKNVLAIFYFFISLKERMHRRLLRICIICMVIRPEKKLRVEVGLSNSVREIFHSKTSKVQVGQVKLVMTILRL